MYHLEGVIVLSELSGTHPALCILMILAGVAGFIISILMTTEDFYFSSVLAFIVASILVLGGAQLLAETDKKYELVIVEDVTVIEFIEVYDIIKVDGVVFTVKFKGE